ncbi:MAG: hypothetical protein J0H66_04265 [Solirubrobacterales bacterium]|nr:hypothetical protein [Solirubrobacterales bacterium]
MAVASVILVGGCGGSDTDDVSDEDQIVAVIEQYNTAVADKDGPTACSLLTPTAQNTAAKKHGYLGSGGVKATEREATCEDGITNRYLGEEPIFQKMKFAKVDSVEVRGEEAQAKVHPEGFAAETAHLVLEDDDWKLEKPLPPIGWG